MRPQIHFSKRQLFNDYQISLVKAFPIHLFDSTLLEQDIRGWVKHLWTNAVLSKTRIHRSLSGSSEYTVQRNSWTKLLDVMTWRNQCSNDTGMSTSDHWKGCDHRNDICIDPRTHRLELHATIHKWIGTLKRTSKKKTQKNYRNTLQSWVCHGRPYICDKSDVQWRMLSVTFIKDLCKIIHIKNAGQTII